MRACLEFVLRSMLDAFQCYLLAYFKWWPKAAT